MEEQQLGEIVENYRKFFDKNPTLKHNLTKKVKLGLPLGSLNRNESNRGCTYELLRKAKYEINGYEPGNETTRPVLVGEEDWLEISVRKPSELISRFNVEKINMAIIGADLIFEDYCRNTIVKNIERNINSTVIYEASGYVPEWFKGYFFGKEISNEYKNFLNNRGKLFKTIYKTNIKNIPRISEDEAMTMELGYGKVDLCWAMKSTVLEKLRSPAYDLEKCFKQLYPDKVTFISTEYPGIVMAELAAFVPESTIFASGIGYLNRKGETCNLPPEADYHKLHYVHVMANKGKSEAIEDLGDETLIFDCTSSGESFKRHGLESIGKPLVKNSTAQLIMRPYLMNSSFISENNSLDTILSKNFLDPENPRKSYRQLKLAEFIFRLKLASLEYGKERQDSIYYNGGKA